MADGQMLCWSIDNIPIYGWSKLPCVMVGRVAPLVPVADSATPNSLVRAKGKCKQANEFQLPGTRLINDQNRPDWQFKVVCEASCFFLFFVHK